MYVYFQVYNIYPSVQLLVLGFNNLAQLFNWPVLLYRMLGNYTMLFTEHLVLITMPSFSLDTTLL